MVANDGVSITEGGKNKVGKQFKIGGSKSMTRDEYLQESTRIYAGNKTLDFNLPTLRDTHMDETIELNSTIKSNKNTEEVHKLSESHHILPPIDSSRMNISLERNTSMAKTTNMNKINMTDRSISFIKQSMISKVPISSRKLKLSKSEISLTTQSLHIPPPLSVFNPIPSKVDTGIKIKHKHTSSLSKIDKPNDTVKKFDEFNRQLLYNTMELSTGRSNKLLKIARKPKINRSKNYSTSTKNGKVMQYEDKISKKAYLERIMDIRLTQRAHRYAEL